MYFSKEDKKQIEKRYIRLDKHLQRLVLSGYVDKIKNIFGIPNSGYSSPKDFKNFLDKLIDTDKYDEWVKNVGEGLGLANLPIKYFKNVELLIGLNFSGVYDIDQKGVTHHRTDRGYFRSKKVTELYLQVNPKTGKKSKSEDVAKAYQISDEEFDSMPQNKADKFVDKFNLGGPEVRKIACKFKKQILK